MKKPIPVRCKDHQPLHTIKPINRLANIQALRALAVLLVVGVHLQFNEARASASPVLSPWLYHGVSGVDLFFVISGFIMVYISQSKFGQAQQAKLFLLDRLARIYPPALLFTALAVLGMVLAGTTQKWLPGNNVLFSFLLLPQELPPLLGVSWTLLHELYFYVVFAAFLFGRFRHLVFYLMLWAVIVIIAQKTGMWQRNPWTELAFHPLTYEFIIGACIGLAAIRLPASNRAVGLLAFSLGACLFLAGMAWIGFPNAQNYPMGWGRVIAFSPGAALMVYGMFALEACGGWRAPKFICKIGDWSYSLYLSHILVIATLQHAFAGIEQAGIIDNIAFIIISIVAVFAVAALSYYGFERPALRFLKAQIRR